MEGIAKLALAVTQLNVSASELKASLTITAANKVLVTISNNDIIIYEHVNKVELAYWNIVNLLENGR